MKNLGIYIDISSCVFVTDVSSYILKDVTKSVSSSILLSNLIKDVSRLGLIFDTSSFVSTMFCKSCIFR